MRTMVGTLRLYEDYGYDTPTLYEDYGWHTLILYEDYGWLPHTHTV